MRRCTGKINRGFLSEGRTVIGKWEEDGGSDLNACQITRLPRESSSATPASLADFSLPLSVPFSRLHEGSALNPARH